MFNLSNTYSQVLEATVPLYFVLILGYASGKYKIFSIQDRDAIDKFVRSFTLPFFSFQFISQVDPFHFNYRFLAADIISKLLILILLALWANYCPKGSYDWSITSFSLSSLTNSLVIGVPLAKVLYGQMAVDIVVQGSVFQALFWLMALLFALELRQAKRPESLVAAAEASLDVDSDGNAEQLEEVDGKKDLEAAVTEVGETSSNNKPFYQSLFNPLIGKVLLKLATNPNSCSCILGLAWALVAKRFDIQMPNIAVESIAIISKAGIGTALFNLGIFMALEKKLIACKAKEAIIGMVLKFIAGPAAMAIASLVMGLHGDVLRVAIIQAAVPQSITSFVFAKEYKLHPQVLSTAVIFGALVSLPVFVAYYGVLGFVT